MPADEQLVRVFIWCAYDARGGYLLTWHAFVGRRFFDRRLRQSDRRQPAGGVTVQVEVSVLINAGGGIRARVAQNLAGAFQVSVAGQQPGGKSMPKIIRTQSASNAGVFWGRIKSFPETYNRAPAPMDDWAQRADFFLFDQGEVLLIPTVEQFEKVGVQRQDGELAGARGLRADPGRPGADIFYRPIPGRRRQQVASRALADRRHEPPHGRSL